MLRGSQTLSLALAFAGALLALAAGVWAGVRLGLDEGALRVGEGPHLYHQGRNYPPPLARPRDHGRIENAIDPAASEGRAATTARPS